MTAQITDKDTKQERLTFTSTEPIKDIHETVGNLDVQRIKDAFAKTFGEKFMNDDVNRWANMPQQKISLRIKNKT